MTDERLDLLIRALAHPVRRALVEHCVGRPSAAGELVTFVGLAPASVSEHLKVLRKSGLLVVDRQGRSWVYETARSEVEGLSDALRAMVEQFG